MTLLQLKETHPALYTKIVNEGVYLASIGFMDGFENIDAIDAAFKAEYEYWQGYETDALPQDYMDYTP